MTTNGEDNVFPVGPGTMLPSRSGLTKREDFAVRIHAALVSNPNVDSVLARTLTKEQVGPVLARSAVEHADHLIDALNNPALKRARQKET